jgi:TatD family-associated radical SAM protein
MGKIAYYLKNDRSRLYLNIVEKYTCTNRCVFCDKNLLEDITGDDLYLEKKPELEEILESVDEKIKKSNESPKEIVFCGIGEPTIYLDTLIETIKNLKQKYHVQIRLNTNGQAYLINEKKNIAEELKNAGLDVVSVSLNATTKEEYDKLHKPINKEKAFESVVRFIKDCNKNIETFVSFIEFKNLDRKKATEFAKSIGLEERQIRFRKEIK